jgi:hypothetical protein
MSNENENTKRQSQYNNHSNTFPFPPHPISLFHPPALAQFLNPFPNEAPTPYFPANINLLPNSVRPPLQVIQSSQNQQNILQCPSNSYFSSWNALAQPVLRPPPQPTRKKRGKPKMKPVPNTSEFNLATLTDSIVSSTIKTVTATNFGILNPSIETTARAKTDASMTEPPVAAINSYCSLTNFPATPPMNSSPAIPNILDINGFFRHRKRNTNITQKNKMEILEKTVETQNELIKSIQQQLLDFQKVMSNLPSNTNMKKPTTRRRNNKRDKANQENSKSSQSSIPLLNSRTSIKKKRISLQDKFEAVKILMDDDGKTRGLKAQIAREFECHPAAVSRWEKKYSKVPAFLHPTMYEKRTRLQYGDFFLLEFALNEWINIVQRRSPNVSLSGPVVRRKALDIYSQLGKHLSITLPEFHASNGWFSRFKKRYGFKSKPKHGERGSVNILDVLRGQAKYRELLKTWQMEDIYNADETAFFYRKGPQVTLTPAGVEAAGVKDDKSRVTALVCCSAVGEKKKLMIIGNLFNR